MNSHHTTTTRSLTRGSFLRTTAAVTGGAVLLGSAASAQAAPHGVAPAKGDTGATDLPDGWAGTIMDEPLLGGPNGSLRPLDTIELASLKKVTPAEFRANYDYGDDDSGDENKEKFTVEIDDEIHLDGGPVPFRFVMEYGYQYSARAQLVRTPNPESRALFIWVDGSNERTVTVPQGAKIATYTLDGFSAKDVYPDAAELLLENTIGIWFTGDEGNAQATDVTVAQDGTIRGHVVVDAVGDPEDDWIGHPVPAEGGVGYVLAAVPT